MPPTVENKPEKTSVRDLVHTLRPASAPTAFSGWHVHFVGIGGSGMSGLAHMLIHAGAVVSGTDTQSSAVTLKLTEMGASVRYQQDAETVPSLADAVVHSAAIKPEHPEMAEAKRRGLEIIKYAQLLGQVMRTKYGIAIAGTHGKSTTTALTAHMLLSAGMDPSFVVGATCPQLGGSARSGKGDHFVAEACEFDRSFLNLYPRIAVVLNIEEDHLDYYHNLDEIVEAFGTFVSHVDHSGVVITHAAGQPCAKAARQAQAPVETYAVDATATWQAAGVRKHQGKSHFNVTYKGGKMGSLALGLAGRHNVGNALVAAAIGTHCGLAWGDIAAAIESFRGADRRSQLLGEVDGVRVVDDYAHHPTEIQATLQALRGHYNPARMICVFQPHQHSRTRFLLEDFARSFAFADVTIVPDIYFVRDSDADRSAVTAEMLVERIVGNGRDAKYIASFADIEEYLLNNARPGDLIVTMGAGPVWEISHALVCRLRERGAHGRPTGAVHMV